MKVWYTCTTVTVCIRAAHQISTAPLQSNVSGDYTSNLMKQFFPTYR